MAAPDRRFADRQQQPVFDMHPNDAGLQLRRPDRDGHGGSGANAVSNAQVTANGAVVYGNTKDLSINNGQRHLRQHRQHQLQRQRQLLRDRHAAAATKASPRSRLATYAGSVQEKNSLAAGSTNFGSVLGGLSTQLKSLASTGSTVDIVGEQANFTAVVKTAWPCST
jgi:hypothetical protein